MAGGYRNGRTILSLDEMRARWNVTRKNRKRRARKTAIDGLEGRCRICGVDDIDMLTVDHVDGNGAEDHNRWPSPGQKYLYWEYIAYRVSIGDKNLQCLCWNHHMKKTLEEEDYLSYPRKSQSDDINLSDVSSELQIELFDVDIYE